MNLTFHHNNKIKLKMKEGLIKMEIGNDNRLRISV